MFGIRSFFKKPRHRRFDYTPMYYNAEKEELEERVKSAMQESGTSSAKEEDIEMRKARISDAFRNGRSASRTSLRSQKRKSTLRFVLILLMLLYICYYLYTRV